MKAIACFLTTVVSLASCRAADYPREPDAAWMRTVARQALAQGDAERGLMVFASSGTACVSCHRIGRHGGTVGPDLSRIGTLRKPEELVESIVWPALRVAPEYQTLMLVTADGLTMKGYPTESEPGHVGLRDPSTGRITQVPEAEIEERISSGTLMPAALSTTLSRQNLLDVVRLLSSLGQKDAPDAELIDVVLSHAVGHAPATFDWTKQPLHPEWHPHHRHVVNRDRIYDFYSKQARHFAARKYCSPLLAPFPGLDGGALGHWGNQNEDTWANHDWNQSDHGRLLSGVTRGPDLCVPRGICVRLGDHREVSACFDPDTLTWVAAWTGGFVGLSAVRHGFMDGLTIQGELLPLPEQQSPPKPFRYLGYYRHGPRVAFAWRVGETDYLDVPWAENGRFTHIVAPAASHPLRHLTEPGPLQWPQTFTTEVTSTSAGPFVIDTIRLPVDNPWKVPVYPGDHDFLPDGSLMICTMQGDVWHATGLPENGSGTVRWKRFASGLHQALGLIIDEDGIFVLCRDQIVCLHDLNQDGEADFYECFSNAFESSPAGHDFICGLQRDPQKRFYTASGAQGLVRISADGQTAEVLAVGFRNPDGLGLCADGTVTVPCSEGNWTPASQICAVRPDRSVQTTVGGGRIGGYRPPHFGYQGVPGQAAPDLPLVYLPRGLDNSSGGQCEVRSPLWEPFNGQMIHTSFGTGTFFLLLKDEVRGQLQGAVIPLPGEFQSGAHRARFSPHDGHLYVSGMAGWGTYTPYPGCLHRVRRTTDPLRVPVSFHVHENGILLEFPVPLHRSVAEDPNRHFAQCWNYRFSPAYGSQEYSTRHQGVAGHDVLAIRRAFVDESGRRLFLEIPDLQPVSQLHLHVSGFENDPTDLFLTIHELDSPYTRFPGYEAVQKDIRPHPILADMAILRDRVDNPFRKEIESARPVTLNTASNLSFATRTLRVRAGEAIRLTLNNPDVVPHNWALLRPGTLSSVGRLANQLVSDPAGWARHYIPQTDDVLAWTDIVPPKKSFTIWFRAPAKPGTYPFLCTFPGHWMVMNGEMIVE